MPSYNQGQFVEATIRSVLLQGYPDLELIVVDGGSNDRTIEIMQKYEAFLDHLVWEKDGGPAHALNKGFGLATGQIFGFLNADDFYLPGGLFRIAREFLSHPDADVVSGNGYLAAPSGTLGPPVFSDRWHPERFAYGTCILVQPATFFRSTAFEQAGGFNESNRTCWDYELWADMARTGASFHSADDVVAACRLHEDSISANRSLRAKRLAGARAVFLKLRGRREVPGDFVREFFHHLRRFCDDPRLRCRQRVFLYRTLRRWSWSR